MATLYDGLTRAQITLIEESHVFFVATADSKLAATPAGLGPVNISPKGGVPLHIIDPNLVAYLDYPGSGNETARHLAAGGPMTIMVCSFHTSDAAIVRMYGKGTVQSFDDCPFAKRIVETPAKELVSKPRQIIALRIEHTQTSCGYGVPVFQFERDRRKADRGRRFKER
ncbi:MAG: pyridoxamine 5'-phosphate oxidase family protein [Gammaproteobacteria bacterium]|nr:pyridoxamine 5'-phosphate oxidase family protein [Gammaproteobacteria bacterium]